MQEKNLSGDWMMQLELKVVNPDTFRIKVKSEFLDLTIEALECLITQNQKLR